jgi:Flp pilus assembly protein TadD
MKGNLCIIGALTLCFALSAPSHRAQTDNQRGVTVNTSGLRNLPLSAKRFALIIGVDQYDDTQINRLEGAANDAKALSDALNRFCGFPKDQIVLLTNEEPRERRPTRGNILRKLSNLRGVIPRDGLLLISFAGHGIEREGRAFLLPTDAQLSTDLALLEETAINVETIRNWIRQTGVSQVVILLDACRNNPGAGRGNVESPLTETYTRGFSFDSRNSDVTAFVTIYATEVGQVAYEDKETKQGYFTWALVNALKGGAANDRGEITLAALIRYLQEAVPKRVSMDLGIGKKQRPFAVVEGYKPDELVIAIAPRPSVIADKKERAEDNSDLAAVELSFWNTIKNSTTPKDFQAYLEKFPNGAFSSIARLRISAALSSSRESLLSPERHNDKGQKYMEQERWSEAEAEYREAVRIEPQEALWHNNLGVALAQQKKYPEAEAEYRAAVRLQTEKALWRSNLARALSQQSKYSEAEAEARKAVQIAPEEAALHSDLARLLLAQSKWLEGEGEYRVVIRLDPNKGQWHYDLAGALFQQAKYAEAEVEYKAAVQLEPSNAQWHNALGTALLTQQKGPQAEVEYMRAVMLDRNNSQFLRDLQSALSPYQPNRIAGTESDYRDAVRSEPKNASTHYDLARFLERNKKWLEAETEYKEAVRLEPENPWWHNSLASVFEKQKRWAEAEVARKEAIKLDPNSGQGHNKLAFALRQQKKWVEAESEARVAVRLDPNDIAYKENLRQILKKKK